jgi:hypothetical protein
VEVINIKEIATGNIIMQHAIQIPRYYYVREINNILANINVNSA